MDATEIRRMTEIAHTLSSTRDLAGMASWRRRIRQPGFTKFLSREELLHVFNEFFPPRCMEAPE